MSCVDSERGISPLSPYAPVKRYPTGHGEADAPAVRSRYDYAANPLVTED